MSLFPTFVVNHDAVPTSRVNGVPATSAVIVTSVALEVAETPARASTRGASPAVTFATVAAVAV